MIMWEIYAFPVRSLNLNAKLCRYQNLYKDLHAGVDVMGTNLVRRKYFVCNSIHQPFRKYFALVILKE